MILSCSQPTYLPALNYFNLIKKSDIFVFLDNVQFSKSTWQHRNRIVANGQELYLCVPTTCENGLNTKINEVKTMPITKWKRKHFATIDQNYKKAPYYKEVIEYLKPYYENDEIYIAKWNIDFISKTCEKIDIKTKLYISSNYEFEGKKEERLANMCKHFGCKEYLSQPAAKDYIPEDGGKLKENGIKLIYQIYQYPIYNTYDNNYLAYMSIIDTLFNVGFDKAYDLIKGV